MLGRLMNKVLFENPPSYPWGDTLGIFNKADLRICNLECVIADGGLPWEKTYKKFHFKSDAKNVEVLKAAGIDGVSLANNHTLDFGYEGLLEMLEILKDEGIGYAGAGEDIKEAMQPAIWSVGGTKVGMISLTDNEPDWEAKLEIPGIYYMPIDKQDARYAKLLEVIKKTKQKVDILIAALHWGPNGGYKPQPNHQPFARGLIDAGVDIIFGHSCHVIQGIELYKGKPIIYSSGDFVDDYAVDPIERNDLSFIYMVDIERNEIKGMQLYPTIIKNFQAMCADGNEAQIIKVLMRALCYDLKTKTDWNEKEKCLEIVFE